MRASKITACACALALLAPSASAASVDTPMARDTYAPPAARDASAAGSDDPTPADARAVAEATGGTEATAASAPGKKKQNLFVRVITAPFRGIAKLFGGGGSRRTKVARVSVEVTPKPTPAPATQSATQTQSAQTAAPTGSPTAAATTAAQQSAASARDANLSPSAVAPPAVPTEPAPGPRRVDESAAAAVEQRQQAPFIPLVVGVPRDPLSQGRALFEKGYLNEAIAELSIAAVNSTNLVEANNLLGLAYDRRGWHKQAREHYERALSAAPDDPQVLNNLGYSLYLDDRYGDALDKLKRAARLAPAAAPIQNNLALVYGRLRKYDDAFRHFARAGGELYARLQTGAMLDFAGRDRDAIRHFEAARRLDPASTEALRRLITLYNRTGQRDKAEAARQELDRPRTRAIS